MEQSSRDGPGAMHPSGTQFSNKNGNALASLDLLALAPPPGDRCTAREGRDGRKRTVFDATPGNVVSNNPH